MITFLYERFGIALSATTNYHVFSCSILEMSPFAHVLALPGGGCARLWGAKRCQKVLKGAKRCVRLSA